MAARPPPPPRGTPREGSVDLGLHASLLAPLLPPPSTLAARQERTGRSTSLPTTQRPPAAASTASTVSTASTASAASAASRQSTPSTPFPDSEHSEHSEHVLYSELQP